MAENLLYYKSDTLKELCADHLSDFNRDSSGDNSSDSGMMCVQELYKGNPGVTVVPNDNESAREVTGTVFSDEVLETLCEEAN
jgi:hypothetical protein